MPTWGERERRVIVVALASLVSVVGAARAGSWAARSLGDAAGRAIAETTEQLAEVGPVSEPAGPSIEDLAELGGAAPIEIPRGWVERVAFVAPITAAPRPRAPAADEPVLGILVRASVVRAAISRGGRPGGASVDAVGARPAGLVLSGVSAYGTALRDGDVLTRIGGTSATSEGRVVAAVSGAIRSGAKAIDGEIWRGTRRIPFVVEIPRGKKKQKKRG